ncbi:MAG: hypothetical protein AAFZ15_30605 [Bacteroidota bacterium]
MKKVEQYKIFYRHINESGAVHLIVSDGTGYHYNFHSATEASLLLDILRNESPVYYDPHHELLATGLEEVGEGEKQEEKQEEKKPVRKKRTVKKK